MNTQFVDSAGEYLKDADNVEDTMAAFDSNAKGLLSIAVLFVCINHAFSVKNN